jgi:S-adenosylmethionine:tRNA ribosyltransferase-isomerase
MPEAGSRKPEAGSWKTKDNMIDINLEDYDYYLPEDRIAQYPVKERDMSQLLVYKEKNISKDIFRNVDNYLPADSLLVFNNSKVIRARILFSKATGAAIEVLCLEPLLPFEL